MRCLALVAACGVLFFVGLGTRVLWDTDEGMHAVTARSMWESGDWVTPVFDGENFYDKPVLFTWLGAASLGILGPSEFAARLPAALCGLLGVLVTAALGRRMFGVRAGLLAGLVLASAGEYVLLSRVVVHDIALALCTTLALYGFWTACRSAGSSFAPACVFWAGTGLATLAKGPVGGLPLLVAGGFLLARRDRAALARLHVIPGILLFVAVAAPWYAAIALRNPDYVQAFLIDKVYASFATEHGGGKVQPFHYYAPVFLGGFMPWTLFLPVALWRAWRTRSDADWLLAIWWLLPLLVLSAATAKLGTYILPLLPPAALLVGRAGAELWRAPRSPTIWRGFALPAWLLAVGFAGAAALLALQGETFLSRFDEQGELELEPLCAVLGLAALGPIAGALALARRRPAGLFIGLATTVAVLFLSFDLLLARSMQPYRSSRDIGEEIDRRLAPGAPVLVYPDTIGLFDAALFYVDRETRHLDGPPLGRLLRSEQAALFVTDDRSLGRLARRGELRQSIHILYRVGDKVIASNRPAAGAPRPAPDRGG